MALRDVLSALVPQPQAMPTVPAPTSGGIGFQPPPSFGMGFTQLAGGADDDMLSDMLDPGDPVQGQFDLGAEPEIRDILPQTDLGMGRITQPPVIPSKVPLTGFHATTAPPFDAFRTNSADYMLDRAIGTHFAKDPKVSDSFLMDRNTGLPKEGARMIKATLPPENELFLVPQKPLPNATSRDKPWNRVETDQRVIEHVIAKEAYRQDPEMLARYLTQARAMSPEQASTVARRLIAGEKVNFENRDYTLDTFLYNHGGKPFNDADRARMVELARSGLQSQGYKGMKYINTSPMEMEKADDPTSYLIFDPSAVRF